MRKTICTLLAFVFLIAAMGAGFWFTRQFIESKEKQDSFHELAERVLVKGPAAAPEPGSSPDPAPTPEPDRDPESPRPTLEPVHDIAALQAMNPDCVGWITVPGTRSCIRRTSRNTTCAKPLTGRIPPTGCRSWTQGADSTVTI